MSDSQIVVTEEMMRRAVTAFREWEDKMCDAGDLLLTQAFPSEVIVLLLRKTFGDQVAFTEEALKCSRFLQNVDGL